MSTIQHTPGELDYSRWMGVEVQLLNDDTRRRYLRLKNAVEAACDGVKSSTIRKKFEISRSGLSYLVNRCTSVHPDGFLWGYRALVKGCRQADYVRKKESLAAEGADGYGFAGAFDQLLVEHPQIKKIIRSTLRKTEAGVHMKGLHTRIVKYLRETAHLTPKDYPFNTKSVGYVSLTQYIKELIANGDHELAAGVYGSHANDGLQGNSGKQGILRPLFPLEIACYDEQMFPFIGTLVIEVNGKEVDVPLRRGYLCLLVDEATTDILGYSITIAERFRALDLLNAYETFIKPWRPFELSIPGLAYETGAGLPSGVVPQAHGRRISIISVDNHLSHLANAVVSHLRIRTGAIVRFGKVRHWISRYAVEGIFAELQSRGFSRIPSTTGSGPDDPAVDHPVEKAVKLRVRMEQLVELIDVLVANHNALPRLPLMSKTANEALASELDETRRIAVVPKFSEAFMKDPQVAVEIVNVRVRGSRETGRAPYVQLDGAKYSNDLLRQHWSMIGKPLQAHVKGDYRKIRVFRADGAEYGVLEVSGYWAKSFHTRETRKEIIRLHKEGLIHTNKNDPVGVYTDYLAKRAIRNSHLKRQKITREAGQLANVLSEMPTPVFRHRIEEQEMGSEEPVMESRKRRAFFNPPNEEAT